MSTPAPVTIGVAIAVPQPYDDRLKAARRRYGDPLADLIHTHITLLGPRPVTCEERAALERHLVAVAARHSPYRVVLAGTDSFRPVTQVVYLRVTEGADSLRRLAQDLRDGPLTFTETYPYHPHVTLAHDVPTASLDAAQAEMGGESIEFVADAVGLSVCGADERWRPVRSFALTGPG